MAKRNKQPWPTKDAMTQIYELNLWGGGDTDFYSGEGSHNEEIVAPYIQVVSQFLTSFDGSLTVCDLGCGDFNVGKQLLPFVERYIGVDIVSSLIQRNQNLFQNKQVRFECLNIAQDNLPMADCVIIRQVLQHLSNNEVVQVLNKLNQYKYIILTEHIPVAEFTPNHDIISGQGIRLKYKSGLDITQEPFLFSASQVDELCSIELPNQKGIIKTQLFTMS